MGEYKDDIKIGILKLKNSSGTVCNLQCKYKVGEKGETKKAGKTDNFPANQSSSLQLDNLNIPDGAYVTAYVDVKGIKDCESDQWVVYQKDCEDSAIYCVKGTSFNPSVKYDSFNPSAEYLDIEVDYLQLVNKSATVCSLECCYKVGKTGSPERIGKTSGIVVNKDTYLRLDIYDIPDGAYVTAFANVLTAEGCYGKTWHPYKKGVDKCAKFEVNGTTIRHSVKYCGVVVPPEIYDSYKVSYLSLRNLSGTVCNLQCNCKMGERGVIERVGKTDNFPLDQESSLCLDNLNIPDGAYVTAYVDVKGIEDCTSTHWLTYKRKNGQYANFEVRGTSFDPQVVYIPPKTK